MLNSQRLEGNYVLQPERRTHLLFDTFWAQMDPPPSVTASLAKPCVGTNTWGEVMVTYTELRVFSFVLPYLCIYFESIMFRIPKCVVVPEGTYFFFPQWRTHIPI